MADASEVMGIIGDLENVSDTRDVETSTNRRRTFWGEGMRMAQELLALGDQGPQRRLYVMTMLEKAIEDVQKLPFTRPTVASRRHIVPYHLVWSIACVDLDHVIEGKVVLGEGRNIVRSIVRHCDTDWVLGHGNRTI